LTLICCLICFSCTVFILGHPQISDSSVSLKRKGVRSQTKSRQTLAKQLHSQKNLCHPHTKLSNQTASSSHKTLSNQTASSSHKTLSNQTASSSHKTLSNQTASS